MRDRAHSHDTKPDTLFNHQREVTSYTPLATPIVSQPPRNAPNRSPLPRSELRAPVVVISPPGHFELSIGSLLIGRLPECDILLNDGLVSRVHARISVQGENIVLEDLHSSNGVFVNGQKVSYSVVLCEGDRILLGTSELSLFRCRDSTAHPLPASPTDEQAEPPPSSGGREIAPTSLRLARIDPSSIELALPKASSPEPSAPKASSPEPSSADDSVPLTRRADALQMHGGVAEKLAELGNVDEAVTVLSGQLKRILRGANSGLPVSQEMVDSASSYALKLARWSKQSLWSDYVVELHLSAKRLMSIATLQAYEVAIVKLGFDRLLLAYYVESLATQLREMTAAERIRVKHLESFLKEDG